MPVLTRYYAETSGGSRVCNHSFTENGFRYRYHSSWDYAFNAHRGSNVVIGNTNIIGVPISSSSSTTPVSTSGGGGGGGGGIRFICELDGSYFTTFSGAREHITGQHSNVYQVQLTTRVDGRITNTSWIRTGNQPAKSGDDNRSPTNTNSSGAANNDSTNNDNTGSRTPLAGNNSTPQPPRDVRTQEQKIAAMNRSLASAKQAAAGGDPQPLQDFDQMFSVTRDPREYKRSFYTDYSSDKLSASTSTEIRNWFAGMDANNDGLVQTSEMTDNARDLVGGYAGADNALSRDEAISYHVGQIGNMDEKLDASGLPISTQREIRSWFINLDKNNDGVVASSEMGTQARAINTEAGYLGDGSLSIDEAIAYHKNRQATMDTKLSNSGLPAAKQNEIRAWFLGNDTNNNGAIERSEIIANTWDNVIPDFITSDGTYTLEEAINNHRGRAGMSALTNEQIAGTSLTFGNDTPTTSLEPISSVAKASTPVIPVDGPVASVPTTTIDNGGRGPDFPDGGVIPSPSTPNAPPTPSSVPTEIGKVLDTASPPPVTSSTNSDKYDPETASERLLASSGLSVERKDEISAWWSARDSNKDNMIQKNEMGAYAQKENAAALADGSLSMQEAITYHEERDLSPKPTTIGKVIDRKDPPLAIGKVIDTPTRTARPLPSYSTAKPIVAKPTTIVNIADTRNPVAIAAPKSQTDAQKLASSGLSTARKNEIKTWWKDRDANKDGSIQRNEMGTYAQKENASALADGKLTMSEAITYHQKKDKVGKYKPVYKAATVSYGGRGTNLTPSMPASTVKPTNNASGFSLIGT